MTHQEIALFILLDWFRNHPSATFNFAFKRAKALIKRNRVGWLA